MKFPLKFGLLPAIAATLTACEHPTQETPLPQIEYRRSGRIQAPDIHEISGMQASRRHAGVMWVHDDGDTPGLLAFDFSGVELGRVTIEGVRNRDWEDITLVPGDGKGDLLVVANTGDNKRRYKAVWLLFVLEPDPDAGGRFSGALPLRHILKLRYPDERQDVEAVAFDPVGERLLFLSKRSHPPRLYGLGIGVALERDEATLEFLGEVDSFRRPVNTDRLTFGGRTRWISGPTGMDIAPDGSRLAVITYRSLYLFELGDTGDWLDGLREQRIEILGPDALREEAVTFSADGQDLYVTSEGRNPPIFHFRLPRSETD